MSRTGKCFDTVSSSESQFYNGNSCWDTTTGLLDFNSSGTADIPSCTWLTNIPAGVQGNTRTGATIRISQSHFRISVTPNPAADGGNNRLRIIIFTDHDSDGAYPDITELLGDNTASEDSTIPTTPRVNSFLNPGYFGRFSVHVDEEIVWTVRQVFGGEPSPATGTPNEPITFGYDYSRGEPQFERNSDLEWECKFDPLGPPDSTIVNSRNGHLFCVALYQMETIAAGIRSITFANPPQFELWSRIRYHDVPS